MHEHRSMTPHYFMRAGILAGFSFYIVHLVRMDRLQYYIAPKMIIYVKLAALALYVLAGYFAYLALKQRFAKHRPDDCDCGHEPPKSLFKNVMIYGLFAFPLLLGFAMPDKMMGSDMAAVKGMNLNVAGAQQANPSSLPPRPPSPSEPVPLPASSASADLETRNSDGLASSGETFEPSNAAGENSDGAAAADEDPLDKLFPADEYSLEYAKLGKRMYQKDLIRVKEEGFLEMLSLLDLYKKNFVGKTVVISGFVYREDDMNDDQFVVGRMAMQCCSADAMPYGFLVKSSRAAEYAQDTWITLTGVIGLTEYNGNEIIELNARKITKINAPDDPYVYPYYDDFGKLGEDEFESGYFEEDH